MSIHRATKEAKRSTFKFRVGAVIVKSGRVVSTGFNVVNARNPSREYPTIHAEERAILALLKSHRLNQLAGAKIYVSRILSSGNTALSFPCNHCLSLIKSVGIKEVIYTTKEGIGVVKC